MRAWMTSAVHLTQPVESRVYRLEYNQRRQTINSNRTRSSLANRTYFVGECVF